MWQRVKDLQFLARASIARKKTEPPRKPPPSGPASAIFDVTLPQGSHRHSNLPHAPDITGRARAVKRPSPHSARPPRPRAGRCCRLLPGPRPGPTGRGSPPNAGIASRCNIMLTLCRGSGQSSRSTGLSNVISSTYAKGSAAYAACAACAGKACSAEHNTARPTALIANPRKSCPMVWLIPLSSVAAGLGPEAGGDQSLGASRPKGCPTGTALKAGGGQSLGALEDARKDAPVPGFWVVFGSAGWHYGQLAGKRLWTT